MKKRAWNFEVYTCNPITGQEGWDLIFVSVFADNKQEAKDNLKKFVPDFDEIILFNRVTELDEQESDIYASGANYFYTDSNYQPLPNIHCVL